MLSKRVAIAWLDEKDWPRWQSMDNNMPGYDRWKLRIEGATVDLKRRGMEPVNIAIDPDAFVAWCKSNGLPISSNARATYAAQILRQQDEKLH